MPARPFMRKTIGSAALAMLALTLTTDIPAAPHAAELAADIKPAAWIDLLPPPDLRGWTRVPVPPGQPLGRAQWHVDTERNVLVCDGDGGHDMLRYDRELKNATFRVECRFVPPTDPAAKPKYNSGVFIRNSADGTIWHQCQLTMNGGFLFGDSPVNGRLKRLKMPVSELRMKPAGEWNEVEITARDRTLRVRLNGVEVSVWPDCEPISGYIALESEGAAIEFRHLKLQELP